MNDFVSIVTLQYNNAKLTIEFLESLWKISHSKFRITIVDNNSLDNSIDLLIEYLKKKDKSYFFLVDNDNGNFSDLEIPNTQIYIVKSLKNGGYAYGCNLGLKLSISKGSDYYLILNNDVEVDSDFLQPLINHSKSKEEVGMLSSKIYFFNHDKMIWFNGGSINTFSGRVEHHNFKEYDFGNFQKKDINFLTGCCCFIPHEYLLDVGLFDESFFFYHEDVDFSLRFFKKGYKLDVCDDSIIYHKKNPKKIENSEIGQMHSSINKKILIKKHFKGIARLYATIHHIFYPFFRFLFYMKFKLAYIHLYAILRKEK